MRSTRPLSFFGRDGVKRFAYGAATDPVGVMVELAWAWAPPDRQPLCKWACPTTEGSYCLECHAIAAGAEGAARAKFAEEMAGV